MQSFTKELFRPTARCFKGFTVLLTIWGVASLLICGLVPSIILVHNPLPGQTTEYGGGSGGQVEYIDPMFA